MLVSVICLIVSGCFDFRGDFSSGFATAKVRRFFEVAKLILVSAQFFSVLYVIIIKYL